MNKILTACAIAAMMGIGPALAADTAPGTNAPGTSANTSESSGVGVKGAPGNKNGPSMNSDGTGSNGASSGGQGMSPSQDATGVKGAQDSTNGPSNKKPGDTEMSK